MPYDMKISEFIAKDGTTVRISWTSGCLHQIQLIRTRTTTENLICLGEVNEDE